MPTFRTQQPSSLRESMRTLIGSSPRLSEADMRAIDTYNAEQEQKGALAEKARLEAEQLRESARLRSDPGASADYASVTSGLTTPLGRRLAGYIRGETVPLATPNDDEGNAMPPAEYARPEAVTPGQERSFRSSLGALMAQQRATGHTNAEQLTQAGGHALTTALRSEIAAEPDISKQNQLKAGVSPSYREPFSGGAPHGVAVNQETGAGQVTDPALHNASVKAVTALAGQRDAAAGGARGITAPGDPGSEKSGDEFLATLSPGARQTIKAVAEGRTPLTNFSTKGGHREQILQMVMQYDPTYNATRAATWKDFTSGKTAGNITSINTSIGHIGSLLDLADGMGNKDTRVLNAIINRIRTETGNPNVNNFETARQAVGEELMRTFRVVGASEHEAQAWMDRFKSSSSPEQLKGAISTAAELLRSRIDAVNDQWRRGTQRTEDFPDILSPKSRAVMERVSSKKPAGASGAWGIRKLP